MVSAFQFIASQLFVFSICALRTIEDDNRQKGKTIAPFKNTRFGPQLLDNVASECHKLLVEKSSLLSSAADKDTIEIVPSLASAEEVGQYGNLPDTLTKTNAALAKGQVLGVSRVESWRKSTGSWQLPSNHVRNNKDQCINATVQSSQMITTLYRQMKQATSSFYLLHTHHAFIHPSGIIAKRCGYIQSHESCETIFRFLGRRWYADCQQGIRDYQRNATTHRRRAKTWETVWDDSSESVRLLHHACRDRSADGKPKKVIKYQGDPADLTPSLATADVPNAHYSRVFVISAGWDANYHHFMLDSVTRLIRYLDFLLANPDVKIHIRATENRFRKVKLIQAGREMRARLFAILGIDTNRVVSGPVYADQVYLPKSTSCNAPLAIAYDLRLLVNYFMQQSFPEGLGQLQVQKRSGTATAAVAVTVATAATVAATVAAPRMVPMFDPHIGLIALASPANTTLAHTYPQKHIVILHRPCATPKECDKGWRDWNPPTVHALAASFRRHFPRHTVMVLGPDTFPENCFSCQIRLFAHTEVLVGTHGAGLTNMLFMPPHGVVVEVVAGFDGRMLPLCGYHGPLAATVGVHHYVHYYDWKQRLVDRKTKKRTESASTVAAVSTDAGSRGSSIGTGTGTAADTGTGAAKRDKRDDVSIDTEAIADESRAFYDAITAMKTAMKTAKTRA